MKQVDIYTDGACRGNPGPGGFGAILVYAGIEKEFSGGEPQTTNNRMELLAAITALGALKEPCAVTLYSDSKYLVDAVSQKWVYGWRKKGWKKADGKPALNTDLWEQLGSRCSKRTACALYGSKATTATPTMSAATDWQ